MPIIDQINNLIRTQNIINGVQGTINFNFANINVVLENKDIIGNVLQSWFGQWVTNHGIRWQGGIHTQNWPDFIFEDGTHLELKTFDSLASPNFDLANFDAFARSLVRPEIIRHF